MTTPLRRRFIYGQIGLMLGGVFVLILFDTLTLSAFFVFSFVGFLTLMEFWAPVNLTPKWQDRLRWLVLIGLLGMGIVILQRLLSLIPTKAF